MTWVQDTYFSDKEKLLTSFKLRSPEKSKVVDRGAFLPLDFPLPNSVSLALTESRGGTR